MDESLQSFFPPFEKADANGLLAYSHNLNIELVVNAYQNGIFPWYNEGDPVLWWAPPERAILFPRKYKASASLRNSASKYSYQYAINENFERVIDYCANIERSGEKGSWITSEMREVYTELHHLGYAHSIETIHKGKIVGGLYGLSMGSAFFGESMFSIMTDASKYALWKLVEICLQKGIDFIDGQLPSGHLHSMGFVNISRDDYMGLLRNSQGDNKLLFSFGHSKPI